jgi:hypothetical protein
VRSKCAWVAVSNALDRSISDCNTRCKLLQVILDQEEAPTTLQSSSSSSSRRGEKVVIDLQDSDDDEEKDEQTAKESSSASSSSQLLSQLQRAPQSIRTSKTSAERYSNTSKLLESPVLSKWSEEMVCD